MNTTNQAQATLEKRILLAEMDPEVVTQEIGDFIVNTALRFGSTGAVIGLSGGVDSTTVAILAKKAFDKYNASHPEKPLELIGYMLPSAVNSAADATDAIDVAEKLGIRYQVISIQPVVEARKMTNPEVFEETRKGVYDRGNMMSRIRSDILSTKAQSEGKYVLGTGNKDEDFGIGYFTLFGDGAVHNSPIGNLPKRLVKQLAAYHGFRKAAARTPTAGLEPGQTDEKDLGYNYDAVEIVLNGIEQGFTKEQLIEHSQVTEIIAPQLAYNKKHATVGAAVDDIYKRHYNVALPKAEIIHPPIAPVTLIYR